MMTIEEVEKETRYVEKTCNVLTLLYTMGWETVGVADMAPNGEIVDGADTDDDYDYEETLPTMKLRLRLDGVSADILEKRAALTSIILQASGLTYTLRESARDEKTMDAIHIHIVNNGAYWNAVNVAEKAAKVAKYGCMSCSECKHQFDDWTTHQADGGRRKRPVVRHPTKRGTYRILPCGSCPAQFRKEFESRMAEDNAMCEEIRIKSPDAFRD